MSHPANSIAPLPSFASAPKDAAALAQLAAAVAAANTPAPEPAALLGGGAQSSEPREPTPQELGTVFSSPYPQLLPLRAEHEAHIVKAYAPFFEHLPYVAYTDVLLSFPAAAASPYAGLQWTGRIAVAPTAPGSAHLEISAVQALTGAPHFCLDSAEGEGFIPAGLFLGSASPLPLTPDNLHALASAIRSAFLSPTRVPPQLTASFNSCPHCEGCNTYARSAKHYLGERALALGCARAFASAPPAGLSPAALQLASSIIAFPVLPTLALPAPPLALPQVPAWPTGAASLAAFEGMLDPALLGALQAAASGADPTAAGLASLLHQEVPGWIYSFPMFTPEACEALLGVTEAHEGFCTAKGLHVQRPNSMNRYGVILRSIGLGAFVNSLTAALLAPIMSACFPLEGLQGGGCSSQHAFIVAYDAEEGKDKLLDMHTDDADVTFNVCLGKEFTGATLTFCGALGAGDHRQRSLVYPHTVGRCVVHRGRQRHGADAILTGHRRNLIIWCTNSAFRLNPGMQRGAVWQAEAGLDPECVSYTHDKDAAKLRGPPPSDLGPPRGWCPHPTGSPFHL